MRTSTRPTLNQPAESAMLNRPAESARIYEQVHPPKLSRGPISVECLFSLTLLSGKTGQGDAEREFSTLVLRALQVGRCRLTPVPRWVSALEA